MRACGRKEFLTATHMHTVFDLGCHTMQACAPFTPGWQTVNWSRREKRDLNSLKGRLIKMQPSNGVCGADGCS